VVVSVKKMVELVVGWGRRWLDCLPIFLLAMLDEIQQ